ncbi:putative phage baseplate assembly protein [Nitrosospira sp. Nsp5]|uniref:Baseplate assembly protein n=1 Tax=Nitrosospira multiformis TaxID=1231 RepID=A0ABY0TCK7_9PROT|nr:MULTISPECIES: putative baseplate assembly protein [Nitrosospira]PTR05771.1 putative phage baseplate assembly protein [Nitrosospira sp. Nsp5]SDQ62555.1 putative baseplate assembly protein [Nitrosospira multiformis]
MTRYTCCDEFRRNAVRDHEELNGIDYLEVLDTDAPRGSPRQRTLLLRFLKPVPSTLGKDSLRIEGGERVRNISIEWARAADNPPETIPEEHQFFIALPYASHVLLIRTDRHGDHSLYRLLLQRSTTDQRPPQGFDPRLAAITFSFKVECPSDFDCKPQQDCPEPAVSSPDINYLAKDYASFRRLLLDRLSLLMPGWRERSTADLGVMLMEMMAYVGDHLSYWQDAVATEAYLGTARRRTSLRRHALLVDYSLHEGSNARVWLQLRLAHGVSQATVSLNGMRFLSRLANMPARIVPYSRNYEQALAASPVVFEPLDPDGQLELGMASQVTLYSTHDEIHFYTWGDKRCCLPKGSTSATLSGHFKTLTAGQVLIFEEVKDPVTGEEGDADPSHRHVVRLTLVRYNGEDGIGDGATPLRNALTDPLTEEEITEIEWAKEDALPFPLCISSKKDEAHGGDIAEDVSLARGNIILADHGLTILDEELGFVALQRLRLPLASGQDRCAKLPREFLPTRFRPVLQGKPLTHAATILKTIRVDRRPEALRLRFDPMGPASNAFVWRTEDIWPVIRLESTLEDGTAPLTWLPRRDLLNSDGQACHFVVEVEHDGRAVLRFGDDVHGKRPDGGRKFTATYRIGNGVAGVVGAEALVHVISDDANIGGVRNPLSSRGASEPETAEQIRRRAPEAFRTQQRAVTPEDYAKVTQDYPGVQRAAATLRWTGSWHTVFNTVDRIGGQLLDRDFELALASHVEPYRMAGHDLEFNNPVYVSLEIDITICVEAGYFRSAVRAAILQVLSNRELSDGMRGVFHSDLSSFGQTVFLSPIYAAVRGVAGVESVVITRFQRQGQNDMRYLRFGYMKLDRLEIPRLDNDPNYPEHGLLRLYMHGGK